MSVPRQQQWHAVFSRNARLQLPRIRQLLAVVAQTKVGSRNSKVENNFSGSACSAQADPDKIRMAATAEEGTAPKPVQVNADANIRRFNSGNTKSDVTAGETALISILRTEEGSSAGAVEQPSDLFEAASTNSSEMEGRARSAEFSFFLDEEELAQ